MFHSKQKGREKKLLDTLAIIHTHKKKKGSLYVRVQSETALCDKCTVSFQFWNDEICQRWVRGRTWKCNKSKNAWTLEQQVSLAKNHAHTSSYNLGQERKRVGMVIRARTSSLPFQEWVHSSFSKTSSATNWERKNNVVREEKSKCTV